MGWQGEDTKERWHITNVELSFVFLSIMRLQTRKKKKREIENKMFQSQTIDEREKTRSQQLWMGSRRIYSLCTGHIDDPDR